MRDVWTEVLFFGAKMRDFRKKSGISREKMRDFGVKGGILGGEMCSFPAKSGIFE